MVEVTNEAVRARLVLYVQHAGYGAMKKVAEASGFTSNWLINFRKGRVNLEKKTLLAINAGLDSLGADEPLSASVVAGNGS